jgi:ketosteroid isomerase-like protein
MTAGAMLGLCALCVAGFARQSTNAASATEQVWAQEKAYWRYVKARDTKRYVALWSDGFTGWPIVDAHPVGKDSIAPVLNASKGSLGQVASYELHRESVRQHGPVVIAFYRATVTRRNANGSETTATYRMTHTWMKEHGVWHIVGGMSAADPAPAGAKP